MKNQIWYAVVVDGDYDRPWLCISHKTEYLDKIIAENYKRDAAKGIFHMYTIIALYAV